MKKIGILFVVLGAMSFAGYEEINSNFNKLESSYSQLKNLEDQQYGKLKNEANKAAQDLEEKQAMKATIEEKIAKLEKAKNTSYYKNEYEGIVSQYKEVIKSLDAEISNLSKTIDNFNKVESLKGGM